MECSEEGEHVAMSVFFKYTHTNNTEVKMEDGWGVEEVNSRQGKSCPGGSERHQGSEKKTCRMEKKKNAQVMYLIWYLY